LWDEEEQGKVGSLAYANLANANNDTIMGVINIDAIAWDSDSDDAAMIHTKSIGNSLELSDTIQSVNATYNLGLNLAITNPGATYSDHASFWTNSFGAVLIIEDWTFDPNPHYHTDTDLIVYFNLPYYEKMAKLSLASLATLAIPVGFVSVRDEMEMDFAKVYPNPASSSLTIQLNEISTSTILNLMDSKGELILQEKSNDNFLFNIDMQNFSDGIYFLQIISANGNQVVKVIKN
jgi:hypothetical protein